MTARDFLDTSKRIEEALNHPALPLDYAGQGWLRRADKAGDDVETFITIPSGDPLGGGLYEGDLIGQAVQDSLIGAKDALPKMRAALEAALELHPSVPLGALGQYPGEEELPVCEVCDDGSGGYEAWPCPTVRAIESALSAALEGKSHDQ